ncbi:metallophosphoesterase [Candidatus Pacearchaeota archaeon]|nr:metallophosphoesterase [Candidatus Pacearchaeota archaeon]
MKFIATGDFHFAGYTQDPIIPDTGMSERLHYIMATLYNIAAYAIENKITKIVVAGDTNHTKSIIHAVAQAYLLNFVRHYVDKLEFIFIDGNHDMSSKSGDGVSALLCLDREPNVTMIHDPLVIENIHFVPWNPKTMYNDIKNSKSDYLVSHFGLNEAELSSGISIVSDLGLNDVKHFKKCILGHYHKPQEIGNVFYTGSIIQLDWGEKHEEKRFLIVDTDTGAIESVPTVGYKKYFAIDVTAENKQEVIEQAKKLKDEGHFVNLVRLEAVDMAALAEDFRITDKVEKDITNRGIDSTMTKADILKKYLEIQEIHPEDHAEYEQVALEVIGNCTGG